MLANKLVNAHINVLVNSNIYPEDLYKAKLLLKGRKTSGAVHNLIQFKCLNKCKSLIK